MSAPAPSDDHKEQPKVEAVVAAAEKPAKPAKAPKEKKEKAADDAAISFCMSPERPEQKSSTMAPRGQNREISVDLTQLLNCLHRWNDYSMWFSKKGY